jgi:hypothetical protein
MEWVARFITSYGQETDARVIRTSIDAAAERGQRRSAQHPQRTSVAGEDGALEPRRYDCC